MNDKIQQRGIKFCFGTQPEWMTATILNLPADAGKVRRRFRIDGVGKAFVQRNGSVWQYILGPVEGGLNLYGPVAVNGRDVRNYE